MFCFLVGIIAIASVRRHKRLSASLFDQRRMMAQQQQQLQLNGNAGNASPLGAMLTNAAAPNKKRSDFVATNDEEIEFTPMTNQQRAEFEPLVPTNGYSDDDNLEVV
jgi:hypothetical protein